MIRLIFDLLGIGCILFCAACIWLLIQIQGSSDGPAALFVYLGAFASAAAAWFILITTRAKE